MVKVEKLNSSDLRASRGTLNVSEWMPRSVANYKATITEQEQQTIDNRVNKNYAMYSDAYKESVRNDALAAVQKKKSELERQQLNRKRKRELYEQAAYEWMNLEDNQKKRLAKAQLAYSNAAEMIRAGQEMNWIRPDKWLSDRETVAYFIQANMETPFGEYVNRYMDSQVSDWYYDNEWLAIKLWLKEWTTSDKFQAGVGWYAQWLSDFWQNTVWRAAEYLWSNIAAGIWEWLYWIADFFWADTSEWSVWDKMKKAEWYSWEEAGKQASSEDMWKQWLLTEEQQAFDTGRSLWQFTTDIAITVPASMIWWAAIWGSTLPTAAKRALQWVNAAAWWADFEIVDNISTNKDNIFENTWRWALYWLWTAWVLNWLWKLLQISPKLLNNKIWRFLFWPKWQTKNAVLRTTPEEWNHQSKVNSIASKDTNADVNFYTEFSKELDDAWTKAFDQRIAKWQELWKARWFELQYKPWENYTIDDALEDINKSLREISNESRFGNFAWTKWKEPQFFFNKESWKIEVTNPDALAWMSREVTTKDWKTRTVNLLDEINDAYTQTFGAWAWQNAATVDEFIRNMDNIMKKSRGWWPNNFVNLTQEWVRNARNNINSKFTEWSLKEIEKLAKEDADIIRLTNAFKDLVWDLKKWVWWHNWAEKALKWNASIEELFREIYKETWVDLNNKLLSWAYNMSMYDLQKGRDILEYFYPSKAWMIESLLKTVTWPIKQWVAQDMVEKEWARRIKNAKKTIKSKKSSTTEKEQAQKLLDDQKRTKLETENIEIYDIVRILDDKNSPKYMKDEAKKRAKEILNEKWIKDLYSLKNNKWPVWWFISNTLGGYIEDILWTD